MTERRLVPGQSVGEAVIRAAVVAILSFALGMVTSYAQGFLPDAISSFANSASGWTVVTVLLVLWSRFPAPPAAVLGAVSFVLLVLGYTAATGYDPLLFSVIGVVVGPFVGVATSWLRERQLRAAAGTALLAGIGLGEAVDGLTENSGTTSPVYWTLIGLVSVSLLAGMLIRRIRGTAPVAVALIGTAATAAVLFLAYQVLTNALAGV